MLKFALSHVREQENNELHKTFGLLFKKMSAAFYLHNIVKIRFMTTKYASTY